MQSLEDRDYFTDHSILKEPYAYFEAIRAKGPIYQLPGSGIVVVTGYDETIVVLKNTQDFSSAIAPQGPAAPLPFQPQGSDITPQIEAHRTEFVGGDLLVAIELLAAHGRQSIRETALSEDQGGGQQESKIIQFAAHADSAILPMPMM